MLLKRFRFRAARKAVPHLLSKSGASGVSKNWDEHRVARRPVLRLPQRIERPKLPSKLSFIHGAPTD